VQPVHELHIGIATQLRKSRGGFDRSKKREIQFAKQVSARDAHGDSAFALKEAMQRKNLIPKGVSLHLLNCIQFEYLHFKNTIQNKIQKCFPMFYCVINNKKITLNTRLIHMLHTARR
jgi:hypothetical protein